MKQYDNIKHSILDTGPLLISLVLNFTKERINLREDFLSKVFNKYKDIPNGYYSLETFFKKIVEFESTPHAIGELKGLVSSRLKFKDNKLESEFWRESAIYLSSKSFKEYLIPMIDIYKDENYNSIADSIGFIDSELIKFSKTVNLPIISIDRRTLKSEAYKKNVDVLIIEDEIYKYIDFN